MYQLELLSLICLIVVVGQVQCITNTKICSTERFVLRKRTTYAYQDMEKLLRKEMPNFYTKNLQCRAYIDNTKPFVKDILKQPLWTYRGQNFQVLAYKLTRQFLEAFAIAVKGASTKTDKPPQKQLWDIRTYNLELVRCYYTKIPQPQNLFPAKYDGRSHRTDIKNCLVKGGMKATRRRISLVQYSQIFRELYRSLRELSYIAGALNRYRL